MPAAVKAGPFTKRQIVARFFAAPTRFLRRLDAVKQETASEQLLRGPHLVLKVLLIGTILLVASLLFLLAISFFILGNTYVFLRMIACVSVFAYLFFAVILLRRQKFTAVAWMLIVMYGTLASFILWQWSINAPFGILFFSFVIVLAGITVGARYIIPTTIGIILMLVILQTAVSLGVSHPDRSSLMLDPNFGDVASYGVIFAILALVSWLSGRRMEQSLRRALRAEAALEREKELLAVRLEAQTRHLREVQLEEMRQLYRFAELGQLSTVLLHELANHLTVLTLDIEDLQQRHRRSKAITRAKESIGYLDGMVGQVRKQLQENSQREELDVPGLIQETMAALEPKAKKSHVVVAFENKIAQGILSILGDPLRLTQVLTIIITNAIESYGGLSGEHRIAIKASHKKHTTIVTVTDWGVGIAASQRQQLFVPFHSSKKNGMGIGLFIAKKMIETHFKGNVAIDERTDCTSFVVSLPDSNDRA
jgi:signal transduction histidine kinase